MKLRRRAEGATGEELLAETFVDAGPLFTLLSSPDHQILHGRRGLGKTHAFIYLRSKLEEQGDAVAFVDLRTLGSSGGIYGDPHIPIGKRGTRLLIDVLRQVHDAIMDFAIRLSDEGRDDTAAFRLLESLGEALGEVRVEGDIEIATAEAAEQNATRRARIGGTISLTGPGIKGG